MIARTDRESAPPSDETSREVPVRENHDVCMVRIFRSVRRVFRLSHQFDCPESGTRNERDWQLTSWWMFRIFAITRSTLSDICCGLSPGVLPSGHLWAGQSMKREGWKSGSTHPSFQISQPGCFCRMSLVSIPS